jgi:hypothetical protein
MTDNKFCMTWLQEIQKDIDIAGNNVDWKCLFVNKYQKYPETFSDRYYERECRNAKISYEYKINLLRTALKTPVCSNE